MRKPFALLFALATVWVSLVSFLAIHAPTGTPHATAVATPVKQAAGGLVPATKPPRPEAAPHSEQLPGSWSLWKYFVRMHHQGNCFSCVGQTGSELIEVEAAERGVRQAFSAGYIWNPLNGGVDQGISYDAAFNRLMWSGDAPLAVFPEDGCGDIWTQPSSWANTAAQPYRLAWWKNIAGSDIYGVKYNIRHGRPVAFAAPWPYNWVDHWNTRSSMPWPDFNIDFWHSVLVMAYDQYGIYILQSWGAEWGQGGMTLIPWSEVYEMSARGSFFATGDLRMPFPKPFPGAVWWSYHNAHRKVKIDSPYSHHKLRLAARLWWLHYRRLGGATRTEQFFPRGRRGVDGFEKDSYRGGAVYYWPQHPGWKPVYKFWRHWQR